MTWVTAGPPVEVYGYVPINVTPVNDAPVAANDAYEAWEDSPLTVYGMGVLGNDTDPEWGPLSAVLVSGPAHGTADAQPRRRLHLHARTRTTTARTASPTAPPTPAASAARRRPCR